MRTIFRKVLLLHLQGFILQTGMEAMGNRRETNSQAGISIVEVLLASVILMVCALGVIGLVSTAIASNNRNKVDSTQTMLAESIIEQVHSTLIGTGSSSLTDCADTTWNIDTAPGGAALTSTGIDFSETSVPDNYHMNFVVKSPCRPEGGQQSVYDVRWHVDLVGAPTTPTNTYMITVAARIKNRGSEGTMFSPAVTLRVLAGN